MRLWRLSSARHARAFDGGFGLVSGGRWNSIGRRVTYCSTVPSLCALEKRVHHSSRDLLPPQTMVEYLAPDDLPRTEIDLGDLPEDWGLRDAFTRQLGDEWLDRRSDALLIVPSVIIQIATAPDRNVLVNHDHPDAGRIEIVGDVPFNLDARLFPI